VAKQPRDYTYDTKYENSPEQVKNRMARNRARYAAEKAGKVHKGDDKDVDHRVPLSAGGGAGKGNTRILTESRNRGFRRGKNGRPIGSA